MLQLQYNIKDSTRYELNIRSIILTQYTFNESYAKESSSYSLTASGSIRSA